MKKEDLIRWIAEVDSSVVKDDEITAKDYALVMGITKETAYKRLIRLEGRGILTSRVVYIPSKVRVFSKVDDK